jgi:hypothetical protein
MKVELLVQFLKWMLILKFNNLINNKKNMSDVVLLRKLSRKSTMKFGVHSLYTVQEIINLNKNKYLRWVYFNCSNIDFMNDILDEIRIPENFRIKKPSKKPELHDELNKLIFENLAQTP